MLRARCMRLALPAVLALSVAAADLECGGWSYFPGTQCLADGGVAAKTELDAVSVAPGGSGGDAELAEDRTRERTRQVRTEGHSYAGHDYAGHIYIGHNYI